MQETHKEVADDATASAEGSTEGTMPPPGWPHQNYSLYVNEPTDLIGLVAYSLYKQHKIVFADSVIERDSSTSSEAIQSFCHAYGQAHQVELLRDKAELLLEKMNEELLDEAVAKLNIEYTAKLKAELKAGTPLGRAVFQSLIGNIVTGAFIALAVWGTSTNFDVLASKIKNFFDPPSAAQTAGPSS